jgi:aspartate/tyrosine/aromatic aminotransferase
MFAFTGVNGDQVQELGDKFGIYLTGDGRISIPGLNSGNVDYVTESFHAVTKDRPL